MIWLSLPMIAVNIALMAYLIFVRRSMFDAARDGALFQHVLPLRVKTSIGEVFVVGNLLVLILIYTNLHILSGVPGFLDLGESGRLWITLQFVMQIIIKGITFDAMEYFGFLGPAIKMVEVHRLVQAFLWLCNVYYSVLIVEVCFLLSAKAWNYFPYQRSNRNR